MSLDIEIKRYRTKGACMDGHLYIGRQRVCDCAENARYALPAGRYRVEIRPVKTECRRVPVLVPLTDGYQVRRGQLPYLKTGNGIYTLRHGQIIVGEHLVPGVVIRSQEAFMKLYNRINGALRRGKEVMVSVG